MKSIRTRKKKEQEKKYDVNNAKPIRFKGFTRLERKQITAPWWDHPCAGTLYKLLEHGTIYPISEFDIGEMIGWGKRVVQNQMNHIIKKSVFNESIETTLQFVNGSTRRQYTFDPALRNENFEQIHKTMLRTHYRSKYGMTAPEELVQKLLIEMYGKEEWKFTGKRTIKNRIGTKYPDFTHFKHPWLIEVFGDYWHGRLFTQRAPEKNERDRIKYFFKLHYNCLVIWEHELCNKEKIKQVERKIDVFNNSLKRLI